MSEKPPVSLGEHSLPRALKRRFATPTVGADGQRVRPQLDPASHRRPEIHDKGPFAKSPREEPNVGEILRLNFTSIQGGSRAAFTGTEASGK